MIQSAAKTLALSMANKIEFVSFSHFRVELSLNLAGILTT